MGNRIIMTALLAVGFLIVSAHYSADAFPGSTNYRTGGDPQPGDTIEYFISPYYKFIQYFPDSRINYFFGEVLLYGADGSQKGLDLSTWNDKLNQPLVVHPSEFPNLSGTTAFTASSYDTLIFYRKINVECNYRSTQRTVNVTDTMSFIIDLINVNTGDVIAALDTAGYYPHSTIFDSWTAYFGTRDVRIRRKLVVPSLDAYGGQVEARLRITPVWHGDSSRYKLGRWDIGGPVLSLVDLKMYQRMDSVLGAFVDSLLGTQKRGNLASRPSGFEMKITPSISATGDFTIIVQAEEEKDLELYVYDPAGAIQKKEQVHVNKGANTTSLKLRNIAAGSYIVVLRDSESVLAAKSIRLVY